MVGTKALNIKTNENETDKFANVKKFGAANIEATKKRAALGDIQNRGVLRAVNNKEATQKDLKDTKLQNGLLNAKARVDSQWKKGALGSSTTTASTTSTTSSTTAVTKTTKVATKSSTVTTATLRSHVAAGIGGERKILTRSNSVRLGTVNGTATTGGIGLQRQGSNNLILGQYKTKTVTTKLVENKVSQVKIINKTTKNEEKVASGGEGGGMKLTTLRREDSNLSRKSLTRLKAALNRDPSKVLTKPTTTFANAVSKAQGIAKAVEVSKSNEASANSAAVNLPKVELKHEQPVIEAVKIISAPTHSSKLLEDIEDIDAGDSENLVLVSDYVNDIYDYLYSLEIQHSIEPDHMDGQEEVTPRMRAVLIDWINEVASQFHLVIETFQMTVGIIDRYLQKVKDTKRPHLQLVGVTALFIAAKYEELFPPAISDFVYITDNAYTARQIRQMELKIFKSLDYNLSRPLPIHFLRRYSKATYAQDTHHAMSKYFCELSMVEYDLAAYKPSEIAAASLFLALHLLNDNANLPTGFRNKHWPSTLEHYSRYTPEYLKPISKKIAIIARNAPTAKLKAVYVKYQQMKFHEVSKKPELFGTLMDSIIKSKH